MLNRIQAQFDHLAGTYFDGIDCNLAEREMGYLMALDLDLDSSSTKPITRLTGHQRQVSHIAFSPDGQWAASTAWDSVWEGRMGNFVTTLQGHVGVVYRLACSADSRLLISASTKDSMLKVCCPPFVELTELF